MNLKLKLLFHYRQMIATILNRLYQLIYSILTKTYINSYNTTQNNTLLVKYKILTPEYKILTSVVYLYSLFFWNSKQFILINFLKLRF